MNFYNVVTAFMLLQWGLAMSMVKGPVGDDEATDRWLAANSKTYAWMVESIVKREGVRGYKIVSRKDIQMGMLAAMSDGYLEVQINPAIQGTLRVTTIIFEMANGYLNDVHQEIDKMLYKGLIKSREEFALAHEIYEYEALRLHRQVLVDLAASKGEPLHPDFFYFVSPKPKSIAEYKIPKLFNYMESQSISGHTAHYYREYERQLKRLEPKPAKPKVPEKVKNRRSQRKGN